jgi:tRNA (guanine6-N2)-methyltransferase
MARPRRTAKSPVPPIEYAASVHPGLEKVATEEIEARLQGAQVIETQRGWVVFQYPGSAGDLLEMRTTEDVFVLLFRTDNLPVYRKAALPLLTQMAGNSYHWPQAWAGFQQTGRRSVKRVTYRVIAQMSGEHGYRRQEVRDAVMAGAQARWGGWKAVADDAHVEIWAPVVGSWAVIAIRLSNRKMRHRTYKQEHRPAALRPTLAAAMAWLTHPRPADRFCDPMCGTGTLLAERAQMGPYKALLGGDIDADVLQAAAANLIQVGLQPQMQLDGFHVIGMPCVLSTWDACMLPLGSSSVDTIACNLPFGKKVGSHQENAVLYDRFFVQAARVLRAGGRAVLLSSEKELVRQCIHSHTQLQREQEILVSVLGQAARIYVLIKG